MVSIRMRVFKGEKLSFNEDGTPQNENWVIKLNEREFVEQLKYINVNGYCKVEIVDVFDVKTDSDGKKELHEALRETKQKYVKQLEEARNPKKEKAKPNIEDVLRRLEAVEAENRLLRDAKIDPEGHNQHPKGNKFTIYSKKELIERAPDFGLKFDDSMTQKEMVFAISKAFKNQKK